MKKIVVAVLLIIVTFFSITDGQNYVAQHCRSAKSCGACIKVHSDCGWCSDQNFNDEHRCDSKENLRKTCYGQSSLVHQPPPSMKITENREFGEKHHYYNDEIHQLKPQQFHFQMKPGDTMSFQMQFKYLKKMEEDVAYIRTSDAEKEGLSLSFSNSCPSHRQRSQWEGAANQAGRACHEVQLGETITFNVSVTLRDCVTQGDAVVSIGVSGVLDVTAIYVTPLCGCDCEKLENHDVDAAYCSRVGNVICGACVCQNGYDGRRCERRCDPDDMACMQMRIPHRPQVVPTLPPVPITTECSSEECPIYNGRICSGNGVCDCGLCHCHDQWSGSACECTMDRDTCIAPDRTTCSNNGVCECGRCRCFDESLRTRYCESGVPEFPEDGYPPPVPDEPERPHPEDTQPGGDGESEEESHDVEENTPPRPEPMPEAATPPPRPEPMPEAASPAPEPEQPAVEPEPPVSEQPATPNPEPEPSDPEQPAENPDSAAADDKAKDDDAGHKESERLSDATTPKGAANTLGINARLIFSSLFLVGYLSRRLLFSCSL